MSNLIQLLISIFSQYSQRFSADFLDFLLKDDIWRICRNLRINSYKKENQYSDVNEIMILLRNMFLTI